MGFNREDIQWEHACGFIESACIVLSTVDQCVDMKLLYPNSELSKEDIQKQLYQLLPKVLTLSTTQVATVIKLHS